MNALLLAFIAASFASLANLFFRRCSSTSSSTYQYLFYYYLISFAGSFLISPSVIANGWNPIMFAIGCFAGLLNVLMMILISQALQRTSAGITYTFQNAGSVFPNLVLFLLLESSFGFIVTDHQIAGIFLILLGLFAGVYRKSREEKPTTPTSNGWVKYVFGCLFVQTFILCIFQARFLLVPNDSAADCDVCLMIGFFGMALLFQSIVFLRHKHQQPTESLSCTQDGALTEQVVLYRAVPKKEIIYGSLSGIANASSTYFLLQATQWASAAEIGLVFPFFAVSVIILCNIWGYWLYQEQPKKISLALCSLGIVVSSLGL